MNKGLHISQKHELWQYIKKLCAIYGEDADFCTTYGSEVYNAQKESMDGAILCFKSLCEQAHLLDVEYRLMKRFKELGLLRG